MTGLDAFWVLAGLGIVFAGIGVMFYLTNKED